MSVTGAADKTQGRQTTIDHLPETAMPASAGLVTGPPSQVSGAVVERESRLPLADLRVRWFAHARGDDAADSGAELATALTDGEGRFTLEAGQTSRVS